MNGSISFASGSTFEVELGGLLPAQQYDQVLATGQAQLGGTLKILRLSGFTPVAGSAFEILTYGSRTGDFADLVGDYLGQGLFLDPVFDADSLTLVTTQAGPGDTDLDGDVDLNDLGNLASSFGLSNTSIDWINGDFDHDDDVDLNDLGALATNFGGGRGAAIAEFHSLVPEPSVGTLIFALLPAMLWRARLARDCFEGI